MRDDYSARDASSAGRAYAEAYDLEHTKEFYETYDVKEGDGMYLAPDARIALW